MTSSFRIAALNNFLENPQEGLQVYIKRNPTLIFYWELSTSTIFRKNVLWQKHGAIQNVHHSGKRRGKVDKKSNKKWHRGRVRSQNMWCHPLKNTPRFCEWLSFWMTPDIYIYIYIYIYFVFTLSYFFSFSSSLLSISLLFYSPLSLFLLLLLFLF